MPLDQTGLTSIEARNLLDSAGPNAVADVAQHPARRALRKLWAPVPWMLEAAILLQICIGDYAEASVVAVLLLSNAALGFFQEGRAQATLDALKSRLALVAAVRRDGAWTTAPASSLVVGDLIKLSLGSVVPADVHLDGGSILIDQSMLTGESLPAEAGAGATTFAGGLVRRGEAVGHVTATGARTKFGRTAELVRSAKVESSQQKNHHGRRAQPGAVSMVVSRCCSPATRYGWGCRARRSSLWFWWPSCRQSPWRCRPCSRWPLPLAHGPWRAKMCCRQACPQSTKRRVSTCSVPTRRAR